MSITIESNFFEDLELKFYNYQRKSSAETSFHFKKNKLVQTKFEFEKLNFTNVVLANNLILKSIFQFSTVSGFFHFLDNVFT